MTPPSGTEFLGTGAGTHWYFDYIFAAHVVHPPPAPLSIFLLLVLRTAGSKARNEIEVASRSFLRTAVQQTKNSV